MTPSSLTILHVDDSSDDRGFTEKAFARLGVKVDLHVAQDGEAAIKGLSKAEGTTQVTFPLPDIILLDLKMPKVHGFEVLQWLNTQEHLKAIPVFILTDSDYGPDRQKAESLGASSYFQKPSHPLGLDLILSQVIGAAAKKR